MRLPKDTMIVGLDSHFLGYRHIASYYLPGYLTVPQFPEVKLSGVPASVKVFAMRNQDTGLMTTISNT